MVLPVGNARFYGRLWTAPCASPSVSPILRAATDFLPIPTTARASTIIIFHRKADEVVSLYQSAYAYSMLAMCSIAPSICANLGDAYLFKNQLPQAASWYRRALFLADSLQLPKEENVSLYVGLATIYTKLNDFDASLQCYQQTEDHLPQMSLAMQAYYRTITATTTIIRKTMPSRSANSCS